MAGGSPAFAEQVQRSRSAPTRDNVPIRSGPGRKIWRDIAPTMFVARRQELGDLAGEVVVGGVAEPGGDDDRPVAVKSGQPDSAVSTATQNCR